MLSPTDAAKIVRENHPLGDIKSYVEYRNLYLFMVYNKRPGEEMMDPFFSVDKTTGEFKEFSVFTDGNAREVLNLFEANQRR